MIKTNMLTQKLVLSYGSRIVMQLIQIIASIIVARIAGPTVLGTLAFGLAFVSMFAFIADLGIGPAHMKLISAGENMGPCISTYAVFKLGNTFLFFVVVLGVYVLQKHIFNVQFESVTHEYVIIVILVSVTINELLFIPKITFAGRLEQAKQTIPDFVRILIYQVLRIVIVLLGFKAVALAFGNLIATLIIIPLVLYLFKGYPRGRFDRKLALKYIKIALPFMVVGLSTHVVHYIDKVVLQYFTNSEQVGYYTAGYRVGGLVFLIATSVGHLFFPLFSHAASKGDLQYIARTIDRFERFSFIFVMPFVVILSLYSDVIIRLILGNQYASSIPVMTIINLAMFLMVLNMPYGNVLTGMGFFKLTAAINVLNLILFIILLIFLPNPRVFGFGGVGAAIAVFASNVFIGVLTRTFAKKKCPAIDLAQSAKFIMLGAVTFVAFYFLYNHLKILDGTAFKIFLVIVYLGFFYLLLYLFRWIRSADFQILREITDIRKLSGYIKGEMKHR